MYTYNFYPKRDNYAKLDDPHFLKQLEALGLTMDYRVDRFQVSSDSEVYYIGFNSRKVEASTLNELEAKLNLAVEEVERTAFQHELPLVVGALPYEQASDFMKINLKNASQLMCYISNFVLCVSKNHQQMTLLKIEAKTKTIASPNFSGDAMDTSEKENDGLSNKHGNRLSDGLSNKLSHELDYQTFLENYAKPLEKLIESDLSDDLSESVRDSIRESNSDSNIKNNIDSNTDSYTNSSTELSEERSPKRTENVKIDRERYRERIERVLEEIRNGEIFQLVLSEKIKLPFTGEPYNYYRIAERTSNAPYACFLNLNGGIAVTSPEMLVRYDDEQVMTKPIAGTRAIRNDGRDDERIQELMMDEKESAEHLMLVDLGRNDLAKVCESGTIKVKHYKAPMLLKHVVHLVSEVEGKRRFEGFFDPIRATFPAGTVSGAPKLRAMELIREIEGEQRESYAGAVYIYTDRGRFESCIGIRCATFSDKEITIQVGSGIVYDSNAEDEYKELMNKAKGNLEAYQEVEAKLCFY